MIRLIFAILISVMAVNGYAQSKIDNLIDRYEKRNDVETTYTERRTPKKQLYKVSKILTIRNQALYSNLEKAFEDERENSVSAVKTSSQITYKFQNKKGTSTYTLTREAPYTLIMTWRSNTVKGDDDDAFNDIRTGGSTVIINGKELTVLDDDDCVDSEEVWQALARQITDISAEMASLDRTKKSDCRRYITLDRQRTKLQKRIAKMTERSTEQYAAAAARQQAAVARQQAAVARQQAAEARQQAEVARRQAEEARRQARYASASSSSNGTTTIYYNY